MLKNNFLKDSVWTVLGSGANALQALLVTYTLAALLGKTLFGEYTFTITTLTFISIICLYGINVSLILFLSKNKIDFVRKEAIVTILKFTMLIYFAISFFSIFFSYKYNIDPYKWLVLFFLLGSLIFKMIYEAVIQGEKNFVKFAKVNITTFSINVLLIYFFAKNMGVIGALIALFFCNIIKIILIYRFVDCKINFYDFKKYKVNKEIIKFSSPLAIQEYVYYFSAWLIAYLISSYGGYDQLSIYNIALQFCMFVAFIPGVLKNIILSNFGSNIKGSQKLLYKSVFLNSGVTIFLSILIYCSFPLILEIYGEDYSEVYNVLPLFLLMIILNSISNVYFQYCLSFGESKYNLILKFIRDLGVFPCFYILIYFNFSVLMAMCTSLVIVNVLFMIFVIFYTKRVGSF